MFFNQSKPSFGFYCSRGMAGIQQILFLADPAWISPSRKGFAGRHGRSNRTGVGIVNPFIVLAFEAYGFNGI
jgi:hypothetical protein